MVEDIKLIYLVCSRQVKPYLLSHLGGRTNWSHTKAMLHGYCSEYNLNYFNKPNRIISFTLFVNLYKSDVFSVFLCNITYRLFCLTVVSNGI